MGQEITASDLAGIWKFNSWKTLYANFHPDEEPEEGSEAWKRIENGIDNSTSLIMDVVFKEKKNLKHSTFTLIDEVKSGPWLKAEFNINGEIKEGWWEYNKEENVIAFLIKGYTYNLYFYIKEFKENQLILIEKLYKSESDAYFNYTTLTRT